MRKGIDVSDNQGHINWQKVKEAGVEFAILRSVRRSGNPDKQLASNIKGCKECGIPFDFYKYSYALKPEDARAEVRRVKEVLAGYGVVANPNTIIWMDVEDDSQIYLSTATLTEIVAAFKDEVLKAGFDFGLYMGKYRYEAGEINLSCFDDHTWIARYYNGYNSMDFKDVPNAKYTPVAKSGNLWGWQYTSSGRINGISGNVDLNLAYYDIKDTEVVAEYYESPEFTLIDSLNKIGVDSSYKNRKEIARINGIGNPYTGTEQQNIDMLRMLLEGKLRK